MTSVISFSKQLIHRNHLHGNINRFHTLQMFLESVSKQKRQTLNNAQWKWLQYCLSRCLVWWLPCLMFCLFCPPWMGFVMVNWVCAGSKTKEQCSSIPSSPLTTQPLESLKGQRQIKRSQTFCFRSQWPWSSLALLRFLAVSSLCCDAFQTDSLCTWCLGKHNRPLLHFHKHLVLVSVRL